MPLPLPDPQLPGNPQDALQSIQRNFEALALAVGSFTPWTTYTPTLTAATTNPTLGTGSTATGRYTQIGKLVTCYFEIVFGSSGVNAGSGEYRVSVPVEANPNQDRARLYIGSGSISAASPDAVRYAFLRFGGFTDRVDILHLSAVSAGAIAVTSDTVPWTWAANDYIHGQLTYEAK